MVHVMGHVFDAFYGFVGILSNKTRHTDSWTWSGRFPRPVRGPLFLDPRAHASTVKADYDVAQRMAYCCKIAGRQSDLGFGRHPSCDIA